MNQTVRFHFLQLVKATAVRNPDQRIWNFPFSAGTKKGKQRILPSSGFYAAWWDLVKRAGLEESLKFKAGGAHATHCPSHFRKTAHTIHRDQVGDAANWITGHSGKSIGEKHYYNALPKVIQSIHSIEQPREFLRG